MNTVDELVVEVLAPGGRLRNAQTAPTLSASVIKAPPCIPLPAVVRWLSQSRWPTTCSGAALSN
ncbi:Uncharacterised protein [Mycobacteroides abscessus subsp. abscessus]|nr:Uncharacterised protein [Mycobacteroides abscessus subsp. abscessus]